MAAVASLIAPIFGKLGRTKLFYINAAINILAAIIIQFDTTACLLIARALFGFAMGLYFYVSPIFISEMAPSKDRGKYTNLH